MAADDSVQEMSPPRDGARSKQSSVPSRKSSDRIQHSTGGLFDLVKSNENSLNVSKVSFRLSALIGGQFKC